MPKEETCEPWVLGEEQPPEDRGDSASPGRPPARRPADPRCRCPPAARSPPRGEPTSGIDPPVVPAPPPPAPQEHPKPETADLPSLQPLAPPISEFSGSPDLSEPARFSELPDFRVLEARDPGADTRLAQALRYATKILHTSRVPAAVWREWRQFEKALLSRLKERVDEVVVVTGEN